MGWSPGGSERNEGGCRVREEFVVIFNGGRALSTVSREDEVGNKERGILDGMGLRR